jgi:hypothetical protein
VRSPEEDRKVYQLDPVTVYHGTYIIGALRLNMIVHSTHASVWSTVDSSCPRGRPHMPDMRVCPPSLRLTSCFITLRGQTRQREFPRPSGRAQIPPPRPGMSVRHTVTQCPCTPRPDNGP